MQTIILFPEDGYVPPVLKSSSDWEAVFEELHGKIQKIAAKCIIATEEYNRTIEQKEDPEVQTRVIFDLTKDLAQMLRTLKTLKKTSDTFNQSGAWEYLGVTGQAIRGFAACLGTVSSLIVLNSKDTIEENPTLVKITWLSWSICGLSSYGIDLINFQSRKTEYQIRKAKVVQQDIDAVKLCIENARTIGLNEKAKKSTCKERRRRHAEAYQDRIQITTSSSEEEDAAVDSSTRVATVGNSSIV